MVRRIASGFALIAYIGVIGGQSFVEGNLIAELRAGNGSQLMSVRDQPARTQVKEAPADEPLRRSPGTNKLK